MSQSWYGLYPAVAPGAWMASSTPYHYPRPYLATSRRTPWTSDPVRDGTNKEQARFRQDYVAQRTTMPSTQKVPYPYVKFWTSFKGLFPGSRKEGENIPPVPYVAHDHRKAGGQYLARSAANRIQVRQSTSSATVDRNSTSKRLHRTDDARRRVGHQSGGTQTALHPPSSNWSWPQFPTAQFFRLHPYLQHRCNGPPPIAFDIARGLPASTPSLDPAQLAQPATHPPVQRMHIHIVAEDPLPHVPWPIEVTNARGITCGDVLDAIARAFYETVGEGEFHSWTRHRQSVAARAYYRRVSVVDDPDPTTPHAHAHANSKVGVDRESDSHGMKPSRTRHEAREGLRRIDYMGDRVLFHGLEQASTLVEDTWFMYVAASERSKL